jgi:peptidylprolyl isomerase
VRKSLCLLAVIASLVSLTACSSATSQSQALPSPGECADTSAGKASKAISVSGDFGSIPEVTFAKGTLAADTTERTIVAKGDGERVDPGDTTFVEMSIYNAVTGSIVAQTAYGASPATAIVVNDQKYLKGLVRAVECTNVGSRVAADLRSIAGHGRHPRRSRAGAARAARHERLSESGGADQARQPRAG